MKKRILSIFLAVIIAITTIPLNPFSVHGNSLESENYIVAFKDTHGRNRALNNSRLNRNVRRQYRQSNFISVELTAQEFLELKASPDVDYIEIDGTVEIQSEITNIQSVPWGIEYVGADLVHSQFSGENVRVAVFDTGIAQHEDIAIADGISFVNYSSSYDDDNGHGTHVAGIIAALNNDYGIVGVAPEVDLYAVKVLSQSGNGNYSTIIAALEWAIDNDIDIINMSLGGTQYSQALHEAVQMAANAGIIIVAAAGNHGNGEDNITYPAKFPEVVSVGAIKSNFIAAEFSSRGSELNIVAPGANILSTTKDGEYGVLSGTSMAAPHVTGAIAILKSAEDITESAELISRIYETATTLGESNDYGYGLLNVAYAVGVADGPVVSVDPDNYVFEETEIVDFSEMGYVIDDGSILGHSHEDTEIFVPETDDYIVLSEMSAVVNDGSILGYAIEDTEVFVPETEDIIDFSEMNTVFDDGSILGYSDEHLTMLPLETEEVIDFSQMTEVLDDGSVWGHSEEDTEVVTLETEEFVDFSEMSDVLDDGSILGQPDEDTETIVIETEEFFDFSEMEESFEEESDVYMSALPTLTITRGTTTSTTVVLTGNITNTGGFTIIARGFWIRETNDSVTPQREEFVNSTATSFGAQITGLKPNTSYTARAIARNSGTSGTGQSAAIVFTTPANLPTAPQNFRATPGNGQVSLSWSAPSNNGGATITSYQVSSNNGSSWVTASSSTGHTFTGLTNGTSYTFRVRAVNSAGGGTQASVSVAPIAALPVLTVTRGTTTSTTVYLTGNITNTGGATINVRGFWIRETNDSVSPQREEFVNSTATSFGMTITGLKPNTSYTARAIARNNSASGTGQSAAIVFTTPANLPTAPQNFRATPGNGQVSLSWSAPSNNGGATITSYQVSSNNGSSWVTASSSTGHTFTGLTNGTSYTFRVRAVNSAGGGTQASVSAAPIAALPVLTVTRGTTTSTTVHLTGNITNTGGATINARGFWIRETNDSVSPQREEFVNSTATSFGMTITGLKPNTSYTARAIAKNISASGTGQSPAIVFTTLADVPTAPQNFRATPGNGQVSLSWSVPSSNGGASITRYEVSSNGGSTFVSAGTNTSYTFTGLTNGTSYTFRVRAVNSAGGGTQASVSVAPIAALPTLTLTRGTTTSTTVYLIGNITNTGGATINARGFWIRETNDSTSQQQEHLIPTTSNQFDTTITGLKPGTSYTVRAIARNTSSTSTGQSDAIIFTTPASVPTAPQNFRATSGNGQVSLSWSAPSSNGGASITRYEVSSNGGSTFVSAGTNTSYTFTGLTNGTSYAFRVRAVNSAGNGTQASVSVAPIAALPTLTVTRGTITSTTVELTGNITNTGGATINARGFWIRETNDTTTQPREHWVDATATTFSLVITGLMPNTSYTALAVAKNSSNTGTGQSPIITFTTLAQASAPSAPLNLTATPGNGNIVFSWSAPANNGGSAIARYEVSSDGATWVDKGLSTSHTFTGLTNGMSYALRVRSVNATGIGSTSRISATPRTVPSVPRLLSATPGNGELVFNWSAPSSNGGSPITKYEVSRDGSTWIDNGTATSYTFTGLTNGTAYILRVRAVNAAGTSVQATTLEMPEMPAVEYAYSFGTDYRGDRTFLGIVIGDDGDIDTSEAAINASVNFGLAGYSSYYNVMPTVDYMRGDNPAGVRRVQSSILFFDGHGNATCVSFNYKKNGGDYKTGVYYGVDEFSSPTGYQYVGVMSQRLDAVKLITFAACQTAGDDGNGENLLTRAISQGATTVVGFKNSSSTVAFTQWLRRYTNYLAIGRTVREAVDYANGFTYGDPTIKNNEIMGDETLRILLSSPTVNISALNDSISSDATQEIYYIYGNDINFDFNNPSYSEISLYIAENIDTNFTLNNFTIYLSNSTGQNGTIDFLYTINGFETSIGYVAQVENGAIARIIANGDIVDYGDIVSSNTSGFENLPLITSDMYINAKEEALEEFYMNNLDEIYEIKSQRTRAVLDIQTNKIYILVLSEFNEVGPNTAFVTEYMYEIMEEFQIDITIPDLSYNGTFSYNTVRLSAKYYPFNTVFVEIIKYSDGSNLTPVAVSQTIDIDDYGVGIYSPIPSSVQIDTEDDYIEITVYKDDTREELITRDIVRPIILKLE
ncbi:MAG: fibronectin type III domain-containing protein [Defluviitaleaceae bacterium]|nr:fibronectin type III domain-containing protein [Defluviitaleaceae bacterium]